MTPVECAPGPDRKAAVRSPFGVSIRLAAGALATLG